jgi:hypothetical protein
MLYTPLLYPICATCPICLIYSVLGKECRAWHYSLFKFLQFPVTSSLLGLPQHPNLKHSQSIKSYVYKWKFCSCICWHIIHVHILIKYIHQKTETYHKYSPRTGSGHGSGGDGRGSTWGRGGGIGACRCPQRPEYWMHILWHAIEHLSHL